MPIQLSLSGTTRAASPRKPTRDWPRWTTIAALLWSSAFLIFGLVWSTGWSHYPFAHVGDDRSTASLFEGVRSSIMGPLFVIVGVLGVVTSSVMMRRRSSALGRRMAICSGCAIAVLNACVIPDYTPLAILAFSPVLVVFAFTGVPGAQGGVGDILYWHRINLLLIFVGGIIWAAATLAYWRRSHGRCMHCGRRPGAATRSRASLLRRGRVGVYLAIGSTLPYEMTRIAWWAGWRLGLSQETFETFQHPSFMLTLGMLLGLVSVGGAALTHGLVATWGERFPCWVPRRRGTTVPIGLAVFPATIVTVVLPPSALMSFNPRINGGWNVSDWGVWLPGALQLGWAIGLGLATHAYYLRRRSACRRCNDSAMGAEPSTTGVQSSGTNPVR